jgi:hypothetical protein
MTDQKPYPAEKARGGEIILNTPLRRRLSCGSDRGSLPRHHYDAVPLTSLCCKASERSSRDDVCPDITVLEKQYD